VLPPGSAVYGEPRCRRDRLAGVEGRLDLRRRAAGRRRAGWFKIAVLVGFALLAFLIVTRSLKQDVVTIWKLLATCPAAADATRTQRRHDCL